MDYTTILWILLIGVVVIYFFTRVKGAKGVTSLNASEFQNALGSHSNKILIDVRTPGEYKGGHIPSAINIPVSDLHTRIGDIAKDKAVFVYCQSGMRSNQAGRILSKHGYSTIFNLRGGILSWQGKLKG